MEQRKPLLLESGLEWAQEKAREYRVPLAASLVLGFLAYGFNFTNKLINHDEAASLFLKGATVSSGRWGLDILERVFPNVSMPWIYGILSLFFVAVAACLICRTFRIRSKLLQGLLAGSIAVFPSLTGTLGYMFTSSSFTLSFLLAAAAVLLIRAPSKKSLIPAMGCMVFSLAIYQSYISLAAGLLVLILIQELLLGKDVAAVLKKGVFYLAFLAVSLVGYLIATKLIQRLLGVGFNAYASSNLHIQLRDLPGRAMLAYGNFFRFFREGLCGLIPTSVSRLMHGIAVFAAFALLVLWVLNQKKRELPRLLLLAALLGILPLAVNCMYLFTTEDAVHTLVLYGFVSVYVLILLLADLSQPTAWVRRLSLEAITLSMAVILVSNIYLANEASLNLYLRYENAYSFYTALAADIKMMPEFDEQTKVAILGSYSSPDFYYEHLLTPYSVTGNAGFFPDNYSKDSFVEYYLGFPMEFVSFEEEIALKNTPEYAEMACYPYYGSMKFIGDVLVVKLS